MAFLTSVMFPAIIIKGLIMKIIVPQIVTPSTLASSNVAEDDAPAWSAGLYYLGDRVIYNHRVWEVIVTSTIAQPDTGALANPPSWLDTGADNRYRMFDRIISTKTENDDTIEVTITPNTIVNAVQQYGQSLSQDGELFGQHGQHDQHDRCDHQAHRCDGQQHRQRARQTTCGQPVHPGIEHVADDGRCDKRCQDRSEQDQHRGQQDAHGKP